MPEGSGKDQKRENAVKSYLDLEIRHFPPKPNYKARKQKAPKKPKPSHYDDEGFMKAWFPDPRCIRLSDMAARLQAPLYAIRYAIQAGKLCVIMDTQAIPWVMKDLKYKRFSELVRAEKNNAKRKEYTKQNAGEKEMKHRESEIQKAFFRLINASPLRGYVWATPNGGYRNKITASNMKAEGQMAGVWDVFVALPVHRSGGGYGCCGLFIEFKVPPQKSAENRLTDSQIEFRDRLDMNYDFQIHTDAIEAFEAVQRYAAGNVLQK